MGSPRPLPPPQLTHRVQPPEGVGTWPGGLLRVGTSPRVQVVQRYDAGGLCGYDYEGCPVWFDIIGTMDPKGLLLSASKQELIRKRIRVCELLLHECEQQSQKVCERAEGTWRVPSVQRLAPGPAREAPAPPWPPAHRALLLLPSHLHEHLTRASDTCTILCWCTPRVAKALPL